MTCFHTHSSQIWPRRRKRIQMQIEKWIWLLSLKIILSTSIRRPSLTSRTRTRRPSLSGETSTTKTWMIRSSKDSLPSIRKLSRRRSSHQEGPKLRESIRSVSRPKLFSRMSQPNRKVRRPILTRADHRLQLQAMTRNKPRMKYLSQHTGSSSSTTLTRRRTVRKRTRRKKRMVFSFLKASARVSSLRDPREIKTPSPRRNSSRIPFKTYQTDWTTSSTWEPSLERRSRPSRRHLTRPTKIVLQLLILPNKMNRLRRLMAPFIRIFRRSKILVRRQLTRSHHQRTETPSVNRVRLVLLVEPSWERSDMMLTSKQKTIKS